MRKAREDEDHIKFTTLSNLTEATPAPGVPGENETDSRLMLAGVKERRHAEMLLDGHLVEGGQYMYYCARRETMQIKSTTQQNLGSDASFQSTRRVRGQTPARCWRA